jgi:hypothetical protein
MIRYIHIYLGSTLTVNILDSKALALIYRGSLAYAVFRDFGKMTV